MNGNTNSGVAVLVHELTHALGFTDDMFDKFIDAEGQPIPQTKVGQRCGLSKQQLQRASDVLGGSATCCQLWSHLWQLHCTRPGSSYSLCLGFTCVLLLLRHAGCAGVH
jgi:hypothetical protein